MSLEYENLPQCNKNMFLDEDAYYKIEENGYQDIRKFVIELNDKKKNKIFGYEPSKPLEIKYRREDVGRE